MLSRLYMPLATMLVLASTMRSQQVLPAIERCELGAQQARYLVQLPADFAVEQWRPVVMLFAGDSDDACTALAAAIARAGMIAVCPRADSGMASLPTVVRQRFRIAQGGMHLVALDSATAPALALACGQPWEFQTLSLFGGQGLDAVTRHRLGERRIATHPAPVSLESLVATLPQQLTALHAARDLDGDASAISLTLDDFHDAAAKGDAARYFAILPDDAVFLGTDASERWTGAEFRKFAEPYFRRGPAWTYVPMARHIDIATDGNLAWFDEQLDNQAYGVCRGSGVLQRREGRWLLRQYNLTIPIPNDLASGIVARIRAFAEGRAPAVTTVVIVRHAEKGTGTDPDLDDAGRRRAANLASILHSLPITAAYATSFRRTQATLQPLCAERNLAITVPKSPDTKALGAELRRKHVGETVVVAGHSNTVPELVQALGIDEKVSIDDDDYGELFVVTIGIDGARLLRLHY